MAKLSKRELKKHEEACKLLESDTLSFEDKVFVYENWNEAADSEVSRAGAFFTPSGLARDFQLEVLNVPKIVDLCAGIGMLSFYAYHFAKNKKAWGDPDAVIPEITCIELNPKYIEIGKKLLPEAKWVQGSVMDKELIESLPRFDQCISNPPFGKIKHPEDTKDWLKYKGSEFEYKVIEVASKAADYGSFIIPSGSTPFEYSGRPFFIDHRNEKDPEAREVRSKVKKFIKETGFDFIFNTGIDSSIYKDEWKNTSVIVEVCNFDWQNKYW